MRNKANCPECPKMARAEKLVMEPGGAKDAKQTQSPRGTPVFHCSIIPVFPARGCCTNKANWAASCKSVGCALHTLPTTSRSLESVCGAHPTSLWPAHKRSQFGRVSSWRLEVSREQSATASSEPLSASGRGCRTKRSQLDARATQTRLQGGTPNAAEGKGAIVRNEANFGRLQAAGRGATARPPPQPSNFTLREETPCGVTTNTPVPRQTKPIFRGLQTQPAISD